MGMQRQWIEGYDDDPGYWLEYDDGLSADDMRGSSGDVEVSGDPGSSNVGADLASDTGGAATQPDYVTEITNPALPGQTGYGWRYFSRTK